MQFQWLTSHFQSQGIQQRHYFEHVVLAILHSLCQHRDETNSSIIRSDESLFEDKSSQTEYVQQLPAKYTSTPAAQALPKDVHVPVYNGYVMPLTEEVLDLREDHKLEYMWLDHQMTICVQLIICHQQHTMLPDKRVLQLCRQMCHCSHFFHKKSNSVAMIPHIMNNNATATQFLNPGQTPILMIDSHYMP